MTRPLLVALALALALPAAAQTDASRIPDDAPAWVSMADAIADAKATGKLVLVHNYAAWCGYCTKQDHDTYTDDAVQAYIAEHYAPTRVDIEADTVVPFFEREVTMAELGMAFGVNGTPATVFVSPEGELITMLPGYNDARTFLYALRFVREEAYETQSFPDFIEAQEAAGTRGE